MKTITLFIGCFVNHYCFSQQQKTSVYFDYNKSELTNGAIKILDSITTLGELKNITLSGNCDFIGKDKYNDALSLRRAFAVKQYLVKKGIASSNFNREEGFGKRKPVNDNSTDSGRSLNRRVDVLFTIEKLTGFVDAGGAESALQHKIKDSVEAGDNITLNNLFFVGGRHILMPGSEATLNELLDVMVNYPSLKIELQGYICCDYSALDGIDQDTHTNDLSVNRAKAVYDYLVANGIDTNRLSYKGFGNTKPLVYPEKSEQDRSLNRRVEIKIIEK